MKRILMLVLVLSVSCVLNQACKPRSATNVEAPKAAALKPAKVLVRTSESTKCAADGYLWLAEAWFWQAKTIAAANKAAADKAASKPVDQADAESVNLAPSLSLADSSLTVVEESLGDTAQGKSKQAKAEATPPKADPKDFDFLVTWNQEYKEQTKYSFNAPLQINGKETLKVEKVSDPSVTKTWSFDYVLNGGSKIEDYEKTAAEQNQKVIIPARAPVLKEIRAFINDNRKK
jgi:hypothetical protein